MGSARLVPITQEGPERISKVLLSNRQFAALRLFTDENTHFVMRANDALLVDQRSFGSLFHRGYIKFEASKRGFTLTETGRRARLVFEGTDIYRKTPSADFSFYIRTIKALRNIA